MSGKLLCLLFLLCSPLAIAFRVRSPIGEDETDDDTDTETSTGTDDDATLTIARNVRSPPGGGENDDDTDTETSADTDDEDTFVRNVRSPDDDTDETDIETETDDDADEGVTPGLIPHMQMVAGPPPVPEPQEECFNISVSVPAYVEHEDVTIGDGMKIVSVTVLQDNSISGACNYVITDTAMYVNSTCSADFEICLLPLKP